MAERNDRVQFSQDDFKVLDLVLDIVPELRICALAVKRSRETGIEYPLQSPEHLSKLLFEGELVVEGHRITNALIGRYMSAEMFPIANEEELASRAYVALCRCNEDTAWAARAPDYAAELLKDFAATHPQ
jgi:hypothetical protein